MNSAVRMSKVIRVIMLKKGRESDALNVEISIGQESSSSGSKGRAQTITPILVGVHRYGFLAAKIFSGLCSSE